MIAQRLKQWRDEKQLSQEDAARIAGVAQNTWSGWEREPPNSLRALANLARVCGVSADYLLGVSDYKALNNKTLPEGSSELLDYLVGMSPRGRRTLLAVAATLAEQDQWWQEREAATTMAISLDEPGGLERLVMMIHRFTAQFDSAETAMTYLAELFASLEGTETPTDICIE